MYTLLYFTGNDNGLGKEGAHFIGAKLFNINFQIKISSAAVVEAVTATGLYSKVLPVVR